MNREGKILWICRAEFLIWFAVLAFHLFALTAFYDGNSMVPTGIVTSCLLLWFWRRAIRQIKEPSRHEAPWRVGIFGTFLCAAGQFLIAIPAEARPFAAYLMQLANLEFGDARTLAVKILNGVMLLPAAAALLCVVLIVIKTKAEQPASDNRCSAVAPKPES